MQRGARVPTYHRQASGISFARGLASYAQVGAEEGVLALAGQALQGIGRMVGKSADKDFQAARDAYVARTELALDQNLTAIAQQHPEDIAGFRVRSAKAREGFLGQFKGADRDVAEVAFDRKVMKLEGFILEAQRTRERNNNKADLLALYDHSLDKTTALLRSGDIAAAGEEAVKMQAARQNLFSADLITPKEFVAMDSAASFQMSRHRILGEGERSKAKGIAAYRSFIDGVAKSGLHPDDRDRIVGELEADFKDMDRRRKADLAEAEADVKARRAEAFAQRDLAISRKQYGYRELEQDRQAGLFVGEPEKFTSFSKAIDRNNEEAVQRADEARQVSEALLGERMLDPRDKEHRRAADRTYAAWADQEEIKALPVEVRNSAASDFVARVGIVPERLASDIRIGMMGSPESQVAAADLVSRIDTLPGDLLANLGEHQLARGRLVSSMVRAGLPAEEAAKRAADLTDPTRREMLNARREAFKDLNKFTRDEVADRFDGWLPWQWDPAVHDTLGAQLVADMNGLFERQYLLTGNEDLSRDYARKKIANTWGVTEIDGSKRLMKYPPEAFYSFGGSDDWMQSQLEADLTEQGIKADRADVLLEADDTTARQASTGRPTYLVMVRDKDGAWSPATTKDGLVRWHPDATAAKDERTKRKLKRARTMRGAAAIDDALYGDVPFSVRVEKGIR